MQPYLLIAPPCRPMGRLTGCPLNRLDDHSTSCHISLLFDPPLLARHQVACVGLQRGCPAACLVSRAAWSFVHEVVELAPGPDSIQPAPEPDSLSGLVGSCHFPSTTNPGSSTSPIPCPHRPLSILLLYSIRERTQNLAFQKGRPTGVITFLGYRGLVPRPQRFRW